MRELQQRQAQPCAAIACDIDHTIINQALAVSPFGPPGSSWPETLPPLPSDMQDTARVKHYAEELRKWAHRCSKLLKLTDWCEKDKTPDEKDKAHLCRKWGFADVSVPIKTVNQHVKRKRAIFIGHAV